MKGTKWNRGKKNQGPQARLRRENAAKRLRYQLIDGIKPPKPIDILRTPQGEAIPKSVSLEEKDIKRIKKEIAVLEAKI